MDRSIFYPGEIPRSSDVLNAQKYAMTAIAKLAAALFGTSTLLNGLACTPTSPASMTVQVAAGEIYALAPMDATDYGSVVADTTHQILKQGIVLDTQTFSTPAPATSGHAINYLIQVGYADQDTDSAVLPYYNASNTGATWSGPSNTGVAQYTTRKGACVVSIKTGVSALAGTQVTPTPDVGYVGAWVVTVLQGATTVTSGNISQYPNAPFLTETLLDKISQTSADTRYAQITGVQNQQYSYAVASGSVTAYTATFSPAITALVDGTRIVINTINVGTNTTTNPTFSPNGLTPRTIVRQNGAALIIGDMPNRAVMFYDLTNTRWVLINPEATNSVLRTTTYDTAGTFSYSRPSDAKYISVIVVGGGGAGGAASATGAGQVSAGQGGGAGGYAESLIKVSDLSATTTVTVGAKGLGSTTSPTNGGTSSFGAYLSATGGTAASNSTAATPPVLSSGAHGSGGQGSGGNVLNNIGKDGFYNACFTTASGHSGEGASSPFGKGGSVTYLSLASLGNNANGNGAGGGGATNTPSATARKGGDGSVGIVIITEYA